MISLAFYGNTGLFDKKLDSVKRTKQETIIEIIVSVVIELEN